MSNFDIQKRLSNLKNFLGCSEVAPKFLGCFPVLTFVKTKRQPPYSVVLNLDTPTGDGTHWVGLYVQSTNDKSRAYYFDSYGFPPPDALVKYLKPIKCYYQTFQIQADHSAKCGYYSCDFLECLEGGASYEDFISIFTHRPSTHNEEVALNF